MLPFAVFRVRLIAAKHIGSHSSPRRLMRVVSLEQVVQHSTLVAPVGLLPLMAEDWLPLQTKGFSFGEMLEVSGVR